MAQRHGDLVKTLRESRPCRVVQGKRNIEVPSSHGTVMNADPQLLVGRSPHQPTYSQLWKDYGDNRDFETIILKDVGERGRDDRAEAPFLERPRRMLTRRAAPEVRAGDQDRGTAARRIIKRKGRILAPLREQSFGIAGSSDPLQIATRDDLVRVDVVPIDHHRR